MQAPRVSHAMLGLAAGLAMALGISSRASAQTPVFINEIHYDNASTDAGEAIEIAGPAGTDLVGWSLVLYNGNDGAFYNTRGLSGVLPNQQNGFGTLSFSYPVNGIQNGSPDGIALVNGSTVVQFLSYEGSLTAAGGPADGLTSTDIGVSENGSEPAGMSLRLTGTGTVYEDFVWSAPAPANFGSINSGQSFDEEPPPPPPFVCGDVATFINAVQGTDTISPLAGQVITIEGVVVGDFQDSTTQLSGFYVQEDEDEMDGNPATSEGIFVFGNIGVNVQIGDRVRVRGTVAEFGSAGATLTELTSVTNVVVCGSNSDFPRITVTLPVDSPTAWEQYEGMAIQIDQVLTVTETFNLGSFGEVVLAVDRLPNPTHLVSPGDDANALQALNDRSRIILDDGSNLARQNLDPTPYPEEGGLNADAGRTVRVGDRVNENPEGESTPITGVLDQRFGAYRIHPTGSIFFNPADNPRTSAPAAVGGRVRVASFNVLNYFTTLDTGEPVCGPTGGLDCRGANSPEEFTRRRDKIIKALVAINADIVGLIELENNATAAIQDLVNGLNTATQPGRYTFINTGTIGTDAIKVGFIYQPAVVTPVGPFKILDNSVDPRTIDTQSRPVLAQTFKRNGKRSDLQHFTVAVNHFKSKGSACDDYPPAAGELFDPDTGDGQGNCNLTRVSIAQALIDWLAANPTQDPTSAADRKLLIIGDLNAYAQEDPIRALTDPTFSLPDFPANRNATYTNMIDVFLGPESYSFVFQGQSGYLDHALANPKLQPLITGVTEWHINADEPVALDYNSEWTSTIDKNANQQLTLYAPDPFRSSDHDPLIVGLNPLCGDLDDDGDVDGSDLRRILAALHPGRYNRRADYNGDGRVDARDLLLWTACQLQFKIPAR